jgi:hypothetical protein
MTTTQRPRPQRPPSSAPDPASRGVILVAVAVVVGVILLVKGGGVGFEPTANELEIATEDDTTAEPSQEVATTTTEAAPSTSVPPAALKVVALNGAGINGYAASSQQFLGVAGYTQTSVGTAANQTPTTIVYFAPGFDADAATLAGLFGLDPATAVQPLPTEGSLARDSAEVPADVNVLVLLGPDVQNTIEGATADEVTTTSVAETG